MDLDNAGWISVKDRLPEEGECTLTLEIPSSGNPTFADYRIDYIVLFDEGPIWACRLADEHSKVTYWMPLPPPPEITQCSEQKFVIAGEINVEDIKKGSQPPELPKTFDKDMFSKYKLPKCLEE